MAEMNFKFNTNSKTLTCSIDDVVVANVVGVSVYPSYDDPDEYRCRIETLDEDESSEIRRYTQLCASETKEAVGFPESRFPGFACKDGPSLLSPLQVEINQLFSGI